jgi:hypothetical protein
MNFNTIQQYFDSNIPRLPFVLAAESSVAVSVATIDTAKRLATGFADYTHPDVLKFLTLISTTYHDEIGIEVKNIMRSSGYTRFCFYLTVFSGRLEDMLEKHAIQYLPTINIPIESVVNIEYYPCMSDPHTKKNSYSVLFGGDIEKLLIYCQLMKNNYIRANLSQDYVDISAIDILGYIEIDS